MLHMGPGDPTRVIGEKRGWIAPLWLVHAGDANDPKVIRCTHRRLGGPKAIQSYSMVGVMRSRLAAIHFPFVNGRSNKSALSVVWIQAGWLTPTPPRRGFVLRGRTGASSGCLLVDVVIECPLWPMFGGKTGNRCYEELKGLGGVYCLSPTWEFWLDSQLLTFLQCLMALHRPIRVSRLAVESVLCQFSTCENLAMFLVRNSSGSMQALCKKHLVALGVLESEIPDEE